MRFLVLYEELATYFLNCLNHMAESSDCTILVYMKKVNSVAPFKFDKTHSNVQILEREQFTDEEIVSAIKNFNPDFTYLSGWIHKPYIQYIKQLKLRSVIIGLDNQYTGSLKQRLGAIYFRSFLKPYIKAAFVPGKSQFQFAQKLGFSDQHISMNVYCCDHDLYSGYYLKTKEEKKKKFPKRFLFVGRYVPEKGIDMLWETFIEIQKEQANPWELWCIGNGSLTPAIHPQIKHLGFVQPHDFLPIIKETGVFVLPSAFEPWGVVVHEFASAGYPIICSNKVGAAEQFVLPNKNGFIIAANDKTELKNALKKIVSLSDAELLQMGEQSFGSAKQITPEIWKQSLLKLVNAR